MKKQQNPFIVYVLIFSGFSLSACAVNDDSAPATYKNNTSNEQLSIDVLSSVKSAISRKNNQFFLHAISHYLIENQFTTKNGTITSPPNRNTLCTTGFFSGPGTLKLSDDGDIKLGLLTLKDFCLGFQNENGVNKFLVINGKIKYETDVSQKTSLLTFDILVSAKLEKHFYFGDVEVNLFAQNGVIRINPHTDQNNVIYNTDRLQVAGDLTVGYNINGRIDVGDQGSIVIKTSVPLVFSRASCDTTDPMLGTKLEQGNINVATTDISIAMQAEPRFCQIKLCLSPINPPGVPCALIPS